jgi:hypothetical protein
VFVRDPQTGEVAATIDCDPPGLTRYYMMKRLVPLRG